MLIMRDATSERLFQPALVEVIYKGCRQDLVRPSLEHYHLSIYCDSRFTALYYQGDDEDGQPILLPIEVGYTIADVQGNKTYSASAILLKDHTETIIINNYNGELGSLLWSPDGPLTDGVQWIQRIRVDETGNLVRVD